MKIGNNLTIEILSYLEQFGLYGSGKFHNLAAVVRAFDYDLLKSILDDLQEEGYIKYCGGELLPLPFEEKDFEFIDIDIPPLHRYMYTNFQGKITPKGADLLKSLLEVNPSGASIPCFPNAQKNLKQEILEYLDEFYGDGKDYSLEHLFLNVDNNHRDSILRSLKEDGFIDYRGGRLFCVGWENLTPEDIVKNTPPILGRMKRKGKEYLRSLKTEQAEIVVRDSNQNIFIVNSPFAKVNTGHNLGPK
ncbi:hypothetical protein [uncultured Pontibacter sp.]|uniref:hypothetical protein n=1 Tax=uncultured Pontibacter sp. TaxID=453356 RepID=UPI0026274B74|nr:hypothetical protein [uncultured Pontibacter sp.]